MSSVEEALAALGLTLPQPPAPVASYVPFVVTGSLVFVSGQVSSDAGGGVKGKLGAGLDLAQGQAAARLCALNLLAQAKAAAGGDLARVRRVVRIGGFVNVTPDFDAIPAVVNGCSDLLVAVLGEAGRHARSAVGVANLPMGFAVEADGVFELG